MAWKITLKTANGTIATPQGGILTDEDYDGIRPVMALAGVVERLARDDSQVQVGFRAPITVTIEEVDRILDPTGAVLFDGARVCVPGGDEGVVEIRGTDETEGAPPSVIVHWDGTPQPEPDDFGTVPRNYRQEGPSGPYVWVCEDVTVID